MTFRIEEVRLRGFRSAESLDIKPSPGVTVITGPNAAGKTNLLEAIELVTAGTSFRAPAWGEVIAWGQDEALVEMTAAGEGRRRDVRLTVGESGRRSYRVNGSPLKRAADLAGVMPAVVFTPDDLRMVKGPAEGRRRAIDELGEQLSSSYRAIAKEYELSLRQRNAMLRHGALDETLFEAWTERLVEVGAALTVHRLRLFERIEPHVVSEYASLAEGQSLSVTYGSKWWGPGARPATRDEAAETLRGHLEGMRSAERDRGLTLAGPHRDDLVFQIDGKDARSFASQGQQRSVALAWKLAEVRVVEEVGQTEPVLLLDDVMSELDEERRSALATLATSKAQTFITTTNLGYFSPEILESAEVVSLGA